MLKVQYLPLPFILIFSVCCGTHHQQEKDILKDSEDSAPTALARDEGLVQMNDDPNAILDRIVQNSLNTEREMVVSKAESYRQMLLEIEKRDILVQKVGRADDDYSAVLRWILRKLESGEIDNASSAIDCEIKLSKLILEYLSVYEIARDVLRDKQKQSKAIDIVYEKNKLIHTKGREIVDTCSEETRKIALDYIDEAERDVNYIRDKNCNSVLSVRLYRFIVDSEMSGCSPDTIPFARDQ